MRRDRLTGARRHGARAWEVPGAGARHEWSAKPTDVPGTPLGALPMRSCPVCAMPIPALVITCAWCGTAFASPRAKWLAVLLAVFLSFWTWLYTYRKDRPKFWAGLCLAIAGSFFPVVHLGAAVVVVVWLAAVLDALRKPKEWYRWYPSGR